MYLFIFAWLITLCGMLISNRFLASLGAISLIIVSLMGYFYGFPASTGVVTESTTNMTTNVTTTISINTITNQRTLSTEAITLISLFVGIFIFLMASMDFEGESDIDTY